MTRAERTKNSILHEIIRCGHVTRKVPRKAAQIAKMDGNSLAHGVSRSPLKLSALLIVRAQCPCSPPSLKAFLFAAL
ncbi:hypothetical protein AA0535_2334 [Asaia krungthepensis NRIC 0535]|uniref:Uncharacterized protein n=1 Tax=Asaia krungthepensis NRIC 0535 TaxID=1307925 RepID=A0ABQ0Q4V7_9PROT|nr:hypothetical protein AA0535_2334 [Asaia krungthepensis NRIC 0535]